jgi:glutathione S-transferase
MSMRRIGASGPSAWCGSRALHPAAEPHGTRQKKGIDVMSDVKLYGFPQSTYVRAARLVLAEKGVAYDLEPVKLGSDELRALHPFGKIPVFVHGDFRIYETSAICRYIDTVFDGPSLQPADARGQAAMEQWISSLNGNYDTDIIRHFFLERVRAPMMGREPDEAKIAAALQRISHDMDVLDARLGETAYLAGGDVSLADFFLVPMLAYLRATDEGRDILANRNHIDRWWESMSSRPSFAATNPPPPKS